MSLLFIAQLIALLIVAISSVVIIARGRKYKALEAPKLESQIIDLSEFRGEVERYSLVNLQKSTMAVQKEFSDALCWKGTFDQAPLLTYDKEINAFGGCSKIFFTIARFAENNNEKIYYAKAEITTKDSCWDRNIDYPFYISSLNIEEQQATDDSKEFVLKHSLIIQPVVTKKSYQAWPIFWLFISTITFGALLLTEVLQYF